MSLPRRIPTFKAFEQPVTRFKSYCRHKPFPGAREVSLYDVFNLFFKGLNKGSLNIRATSIAFHFMLALGPALVFFLTLIPYLPISNLETQLMEIVYDVIPENSYIALESLVASLFTARRGLQIFGFLVTLFFVQKGLSGIIQAFHTTYHTIESRTWLERRLVSLLLFAIFFFLASASILLMFLSHVYINHLYVAGIIKLNANNILIVAGRWLIMATITFLGISSMYFFAPARKTKWKFFSPGSIFATVFSLGTSVIFSYFINHFAPFDDLFGSIGTLIAVMLWLNFNSLVLLAGFELNVSINNARYRLYEPISL